MKPLPEKPTHFFGNVLFEYVPKIDYLHLEELSQLAIHNGNLDKGFIFLQDALVKISWASISAAFAQEINAEVISQYENDKLLIDSICQVSFEKSIFEFVIHTKSALDSICNFLNTYYEMGFTRGDIDFRHERFIKLLINRDANFRNFFDNCGPWLRNNKNDKTSESIIELRDFWIHQSSTLIYMSPIAVEDIEAFPIPIKLSRSVDENSYLSPTKFFGYHFANLQLLFSICVEAAIKIERIMSPSFEIVHHDKIGLTPIFPLKPVNLHKIKIGKRNNEFNEFFGITSEIRLPDL